MNDSSHRILLVDDTPSIHDDYRKILSPRPENAEFNALEAAVLGDSAPETQAPRPHSFSLTHAYQGQEALELLQESLREDRPFSLAFVDMRMPPGWDGLETTRRLRECDPRLQIVLCTAYSDHTWSRITEVLRPTDDVLVLKKPFDNIEAVQMAHALTAKWTLQRHAESHINHLDTLARDRGSALEAAERRFTAAFLGGSGAYVIVDLSDGRVVQANPAFRHLFKLNRPAENEELSWVVQWENPEEIKNLLQHLAAGRVPVGTETTVPSGGGKRRHLRVEASPFLEQGRALALLNFSDISETRRLENQLQRAQKMEAIGSLAAGIAHDFNNVLTVITGFTNVVQMADNLPASVRSQLDHVEQAADRATKLTRQLLMFSRRESSEPVEFDPATSAQGMRSMVERLIGENTELIWSCPQGHGTIKADPSGFEQILLNLVVNARDAIENHGRIKVQVEVLETLALTADPASQDRRGQHVRLQVSDNGCGMSPETVSRIFEPFFTSKDPGRGTGLGLATVYGIVKRHHGWVDVTSKPAEGSTFSVYFPLAGTRVVDSSAPLATASDLALPGLRILAVEDDKSVCDVLSFMLAPHGFDLSIAHDAPAAQKIWHEKKGEFDLLLTDLVLPNGMNGRELASDLRRHNSQLAVVIASGYDSESVPDQSLGEGPEPIFIGKPYNSAGLLIAIDQALPSVGSGTSTTEPRPDEAGSPAGSLNSA